MRVLFKNGTVVSGKGTRRADVLVDGEKIRRVAREIHVDDAQIVDAAGMLLMPGFIDAHTHFDLDVCNTTTADDFASGSRAALRGGTTTIVDFACPNKGETLHDGLRLWHEKADGKCACDYGFHMTIDDWNDTIESEIDDMYAEGISSFKMYMTYPAMMIGDKLMYKALKKLKEKGGICGVHCENAGVIDALIEEKKAAGEQGSVGSHPRTRPDFLEAEAVGRLLHIAEAVDIPVVIVHTTNEAALREIEAARRRGQKVYVETCPQYLVLDDSVYDNEDWLQAAKYVCAPPIRKTEDQRVLWAALRKGEIQTVVKADIVEDTAITSFKLGSNVKADGTTYKYSSAAEYDVEVLDNYTGISANGVNLKDITYNIYLDTHGNLLGVDKVTAADNYVFIAGVDKKASNLSAKNYDASAIFTDGTMKTITFKADKSKFLSGTTMDALTNTWCTYTVDKDGVYTLTEVKDTINEAKNIKVAQKHDASFSDDIDKKHIALEGGTGYAGVYGNDNTVYLLAELKSIKTTAIATDYTAIISGVQSVTTGVKNASRLGRV